MTTELDAAVEVLRATDPAIADILSRAEFEVS